MKIGFTGTQRGMTLRQAQRFQWWLGHQLANRFTQHEFHHGDCIGADLGVDEIVRDLRQRAFDPLPIHIHIHPPSDPRKRAFRTTCADGDVLYAAAPYLKRNHAIVDATEWLVACPHEVVHDVCRHGTCATVRYARKVGKPVLIVLPDGVYVTP